MPTIALRAFSSHAEWVAAAADLLAGALTAPYSAPGGVILPGGSTPKPIFDAVSQRGITASPMVHIFFSDERMVPPDSAQSNYALSHPLLDALEIPPERIHEVQTHLTTEAAADTLDAELGTFFTGGGTIALALLGLGADGHTASLFNEADLARAEARWASATFRLEPPDRVTLSPKTLSRADRVIFLAAGADKTAVIQTLAHTPNAVVAGRAVAGAEHVELWTA